MCAYALLGLVAPVYVLFGVIRLAPTVHLLLDYDQHSQAVRLVGLSHSSSLSG